MPHSMLTSFIVQHLIHWILGGGLALVFSAAARALPDPVQNSSRLYLFLYRFVQGLMANPDLKEKAKAL